MILSNMRAYRQPIKIILAKLGIIPHMKNKSSSTLLTKHDKKILEKYAGSQSVAAGTVSLDVKHAGRAAEKGESGRQNTDVGNIH